MSDLRVTRLRGRTAGSSPSLPDGAVVTGVTTSTSFKGLGNDQSILAGSLKINDTTQSTTPTTGAVVISGGVGIAKSLHVGGNVSVGGTLTYEDVTNQDVLGLSTFRSGVKFGVSGVGGTVTADGYGSLEGGLNVAGIVTATSYRGDGSQLTGIDAAPTIQAVANGAIAANKPVILLGNGKVEQAQNFAPADTGKFDETVINYMPGFDQTTSTDYLDSSSSLYEGGEFMADYDPVNGKILAIRHDQTTYAPTLYVGTPSFDSGDNKTVTWDSGTAISGSFNSGDYGAVIRYNPHYKKFLVMWNKTTSGQEGVNTCHVSLSGGTLTIGTVSKIPLWSGQSGNRLFYNVILTMCYEDLRHSIVFTARVAENEGSNRRQHITKAVNMSGDTPVFGANYFELIDHSNQQGYFIQPTFINQDSTYNTSTQRICYFSSFTMRNSQNNFAHYLAAVSITVTADFQISRGTIATYEDHWNKSEDYDERAYSARIAYHKDKGLCTAFWYKGSYTSEGLSQTSYACPITYEAANPPTRGTILSFNQDEADGDHTLWGGDQCTMIGRDDGTSYWMARRSNYTTGSPAIWPRLGIKFTMSGATGSETIAVQFITNSWKSGGATALGTTGFSWWQSNSNAVNGGSYSTGEQCCGIDIGQYIWWIGGSRGSITSTDAAYQKRVIVHGGYFIGGGNLTSDNYLGFSDAAYTDGQTVKVKVIGNTTTQTGLTTNTNYYVTSIGDITTADANNILIGKAFTHNQILIKN